MRGKRKEGEKQVLPVEVNPQDFLLCHYESGGLTATLVPQVDFSDFE